MNGRLRNFCRKSSPYPTTNSSGTSNPTYSIGTSTSRRTRLSRSVHTFSEAGRRTWSSCNRVFRVMPVSTMSSTKITSRPASGSSRSFRIRTAPPRSPSNDEIAMKSISRGSEMCRIRSAMKQVTPRSTPTSSGSLPRYSREICAPSSSTRCSSSETLNSTSSIPATSTSEKGPKPYLASRLR